MRRHELNYARPGLYLIDGDMGDMAGLVISGPYPATPEGQMTAEAERAKAELRLRRPVTVSQVTDMPDPLP